jgi:hypothetical protein
VFTIFKVLVEKHNGFQTKFFEKKMVVRKLLESECTSKEYTCYCKSHGIGRQLITISYAPQLNSATKRKNVKIAEITRCMLKSKNMSPMF